MSDIKVAIRDFLIAEDSLGDATREDAREELRQLIENRIFFGRRPQAVDGIALTLDRGGGQVEMGISGPVDCSMPEIDFTLWSTDTPGDEGKSEQAYVALRTLLNQYRGNLNDEVTVQTIQLEAEAFDQPVSPVDSSGRWHNRKTFTFMVAHHAAVGA